MVGPVERIFLDVDCHAVSRIFEKLAMILWDKEIVDSGSPESGEYLPFQMMGSGMLMRGMAIPISWSATASPR